MAKRVSKQNVFDLANELSLNGKEATSTVIREQLGFGSLTTITKYLKEWKSVQEKSETMISLKDVLATVDIETLSEFLSNELPQVTALTLSYLEPKKAAKVLSTVSEEMRDDILYRMENIGFVQSRIVSLIAKVLKIEFQAIKVTQSEQVGGRKFVNSVRQELAI